MAEATPTPETTGTAPATPGASPSETPLATPPVEAAKAPTPDVVKPVIPDKYEFKLAADRKIDAGLVDAVAPIFKEIGMTQEQASKLVESFDKYGQTFEAAQEKAFQEFMQKTTNDNIAAAKKMWGNDYVPNLAIAQRGMARFLSDAGKKKLEDSGLGNDPEFLNAWFQAGKMIQEDKPPLVTTPKLNGASKLFQKSLGVNH